MSNKIIHKRSSVITDGLPKLPSTDALDYGEIAINYANGAEVISLKNTSNEIVEFRSKEYFEKIIDDYQTENSKDLNELSESIKLKNVQAIDIGDVIDDVTIAYATKAYADEINQKVVSKQNIISDLDTIRQGAAKGATALQSYTEQYKGTYSKPSGGIPKSDLASEIQTSLSKADTALQFYTEQYKGTVTGVKINGVTKAPSGGIVDLGTIDIPENTIDAEMSDTSTNAVQNNIIKSYIDSNCNIPIETTTSSSKSLTPNIYYRWTNTPSYLTITLATPSNSNILNNYMFEFTASSSGCSLSLPSSIKWINGTAPSIEASKTYQISIINNLATVAKFG